MIIGHGIDIEQISRIKAAYAKHSRFAQQVLTDKEYEVFAGLTGQRQMAFLAGRWSAKEAFSKAWGTGIGTLGFRDIEILNDDRGKPVLTSKVFDGICHVSISHSGDLVQASVILEEV